jgi:hypothetical protein
MSVKIEVTHYYFNPPSTITEEVYNTVKYKLQNDSNFSLFDKSENITNEFNLKFFLYILIGSLVCTGIAGLIDGSDGFAGFITGVFGIPGVLGLLFLIISPIFLFQSMFNFSRYIKRKRNYFQRLESTIRKSNNYHEFYNNFYI